MLEKKRAEFRQCQVVLGVEPLGKSVAMLVGEFGVKAPPSSRQRAQGFASLEQSKPATQGSERDGEALRNLLLSALSVEVSLCGTLALIKGKRLWHDFNSVKRGTVAKPFKIGAVIQEANG